MIAKVREYPRTAAWVTLSGYLMLLVEAFVK